MTHIIVAALYKFVELPDYKDIQGALLKVCKKNGVMGTLLLAQEGINGTIAGSRAGIDAVLTYLKSDARFADLEHKESYTDTPPFYRIKVRLKKEIVTIGLPDVNPNHLVGHYVSPEEWNDLLDDPEVIVIDTRNAYECDIGTFEGAIDPKTTSFREFPKYVRENLASQKDKRVAMFCTGGIRCEKASSFMLSEGFKTVYHLKGGILKYLETIPSEKSKWKGECFVFDNRVSVNNDLAQGNYDLCHGCRHPITEEDKASPVYEAGVSCPHCYEKVAVERLGRFRERQKQIKLAKKRGQSHIGSEAQPVERT